MHPSLLSHSSSHLSLHASLSLIPLERSLRQSSGNVLIQQVYLMDLPGDGLSCMSYGERRMCDKVREQP